MTDFEKEEKEETYSSCNLESINATFDSLNTATYLKIALAANDISVDQYTAELILNLLRMIKENGGDLTFRDVLAKKQEFEKR